MRPYYFLILCCLFSLALSAQPPSADTAAHYPDFSEDYYAYALLNVDGEYEGELLIREKKTHKLVLNLVNLAEFAITSKNVPSEGLVNGSGAEEEETIGLLYQDFNFDGVKDFAVYQHFGRRGPVYEIYLKRGEEFKYSKSFNKWTGQGLYDVDYDKQRLYITQTGGAFHHWTGSFRAKGIELETEYTLDERGGGHTAYSAMLTFVEGQDTTVSEAFVSEYFEEELKDGFMQVFHTELGSQPLILFSESGNDELQLLRAVEKGFPCYNGEDKIYKVIEAHYGTGQNPVDFKFSQKGVSNILSFSHNGINYKLKENKKKELWSFSTGKEVEYLNIEVPMTGPVWTMDLLKEKGFTNVQN